MAFTANFGGKPRNPIKNQSNSMRTLLFTCLFGGSVVWMAYRASITSDLSVIKVKYPFNNLETLLHTDYT